MDAPSPQFLRVNKYVWICLAFVPAYLLLGQAQRPFDAPAPVAWAIFMAAAASVSARTLLDLRTKRIGYWNRVFNYVDIVLVSAAVAATHGIDSDLWLIYFALTTFAALYATRLSKFPMDLTVGILYMVATAPHQMQAVTALPAIVYVQILVTRLFFLSLVSGLARRLSADAEDRNREVLRLREQMASSEERARIAREVHDSLGHTMVSTLLRLDLCSRLIKTDAGEASEILDAEIPALRAAWNEARDLAFHLRPWNTEIASDGLVAALRGRCAKFAERTGLAVQVAAADEHCALRPEAAFALIRIVQETLTNTAKHARASRIDINLGPISAGMLRCEIIDDGIGFDAREAADGVGLETMRERAETMGGSLHVSAGPDGGTHTVVALPA